MNKRRYPAHRAMPWHVAGWVAAVVLLVAGCTSGSADGGTAASSTSVSSSAPTPSVASVPPTPSGSVLQSSTSTSGAGTDPNSTTNPWPSDFTPEQQLMAQQALNVYQHAWKAIDAAYAAPASKNWEPEIRQYMADPRAQQVLKAIDGLIADQVHTTGQTSVSAVVTGIKGTGSGVEVTIEACIDSTGGDLIDANGKSVLVPQPGGQRTRQYGNVFQYSDSTGGWLLSEITVPQPYQSC